MQWIILDYILDENNIAIKEKTGTIQEIQI